MERAQAFAYAMLLTCIFDLNICMVKSFTGANVSTDNTQLKLESRHDRPYNHTMQATKHPMPTCMTHLYGR
jgi:hypothetical protein